MIIVAGFYDTHLLPIGALLIGEGSGNRGGVRVVF